MSLCNSAFLLNIIDYFFKKKQFTISLNFGLEDFRREAYNCVTLGRSVIVIFSSSMIFECNLFLSLSCWTHVRHITILVHKGSGMHGIFPRSALQKLTQRL